MKKQTLTLIVSAAFLTASSSFGMWEEASAGWIDVTRTSVPEKKSNSTFFPLSVSFTQNSLRSESEENNQEKEPLLFQGKVSEQDAKSFPTTSSTWIINPSKVLSFDEDKQKWLAEALSKSQVKVIYNKDLKTEAYDPIPFRPQSLTALVTGKHVSIYLILPGLEELHVGLVVKDMLALKGEALQEFRKMLQNVAHSFQALGYGDYLAFCDFGKKYQSTSGQIMEGQCLEMIPLGKHYVTQKNGKYNLAQKVWRNNYLLFNRTPDFKQPNFDITKQFVKFLQSCIVDDIPYCSSLCEETLPWTLHITDLENAKQIATNRILATLQKLGAIQVLNPFNTALSIDENKEKTLTDEFNYTRTQERVTCAFCDPEVLKKQGMAQDKDISVVYNRNAYSKQAHFMVIPTDHKESLHCLGNDQLEKAIQWAQKISFILNDRENLVWFCQNGPRAGQTVPHTHIHVLRRPDPLYFSMLIFNELGSNKLEPYGEKDFQAAREWIQEQLKALDL